MKQSDLLRRPGRPVVRHSSWPSTSVRGRSDRPRVTVVLVRPVGRAGADWREGRRRAGRHTVRMRVVGVAMGMVRVGMWVGRGGHVCVRSVGVRSMRRVRAVVMVVVGVVVVWHNAGKPWQSKVCRRRRGGATMARWRATMPRHRAAVARQRSARMRRWRRRRRMGIVSVGRRAAARVRRPAVRRPRHGREAIVAWGELAPWLPFPTIHPRRGHRASRVRQRKRRQVGRWRRERKVEPGADVRQCKHPIVTLAVPVVPGISHIARIAWVSLSWVAGLTAALVARAPHLANVLVLPRVVVVGARPSGPDQRSAVWWRIRRRRRWADGRRQRDGVT